MNGVSKRFFTSLPMVLALLFAATRGQAESIQKTGDFYSVKVTTNKQDGKEVATIEVAGRSGYHCNTLYRWKLAVDAAPGIKLENKLLQNKDAERFGADRVVFRIRYFGGLRKKMAASLKFSVCNEKQCLMEVVDLRW